VLDSDAEGPVFKSQSRRCRVTGVLSSKLMNLFKKQFSVHKDPMETSNAVGPIDLGKLFTPIVPLFTKQQNWEQLS